MRKLAHLFKTFLRNETGLVTVEFVIGVPVLLAALVFSYEFGRAFLAYESASQDIQAATRFLSHAPASADLTSDSDPYVVTAKNLAECGDPSLTATACSNPHFPWNWSTSATITQSTAYTCQEAAGCTSFNQDVSVIQLQASVPMTLGFLAFLGIGTAYTFTIADQAQWIGN